MDIQEFETFINDNVFYTTKFALLDLTQYKKASGQVQWDTNKDCQEIRDKAIQNFIAQIKNSVMRGGGHRIIPDSLHIFRDKAIEFKGYSGFYGWVDYV